MIGPFRSGNRSYCSTGRLRQGMFLVLMICSLTISDAAAQKVRAYVSADSVSVGERFRLSIVAEHVEGTIPIFPSPTAFDSTLGDLLVLKEEDPISESRVIAGSRVQVDSVAYEVTTFALDTARVPVIPVGFLAGADTLTLPTAPMMVFVRSHVEKDAQDIKDLAPIVEFPVPLWPWVLLALALLAAGWIGYRLYKRYLANRPIIAVSAEPDVVLSPFDQAMQRLLALREVDLEQPERVRPYYIELSDVLRMYLEHRLGIPALETTTREILRDLNRVPAILEMPSGTASRVRQTLEMADLVKFAEVKPTTAASHKLLIEAETSVKTIENHLLRREGQVVEVPVDHPHPIHQP